jgi:hypothetical protein
MRDGKNQGGKGTKVEIIDKTDRTRYGGGEISGIIAYSRDGYGTIMRFRQCQCRFGLGRMADGRKASFSHKFGWLMIWLDFINERLARTSVHHQANKNLDCYPPASADQVQYTPSLSQTPDSNCSIAL